MASSKTAALSISSAIVTSAFVFAQKYSYLKALCIVLAGGYLPYYFDGSEYDGRRYKNFYGKSGLASFIWRKLIGLPKAEVRWNEKDYTNKEKQCIFASHPHGVFGWHHMGCMITPVNSEAGKSFEDLSPQTNRLELAATLVFTIPLLRDACLVTGLVDARRKVCRHHNCVELC